MVVSRPVGRQVSGGRSAAGMSPGQTSRPGSSFSGTSALSPGKTFLLCPLKKKISCQKSINN